MNPDQLIVFLDNLQRTVVATLVSDTPEVLSVIKPAILNVVPTQDKKLQVQLYPMMFREFLKDRDVFPVWNYPKSAVVIAPDLELEGNLIKQYTEMFKVNKTEPPTTIKLFDSETK